MQQHHSILAGDQATTFAHDVMGLPIYNPMTEKDIKNAYSLKKAIQER